ncbi:MAG: nucleotidyltransferase domain-containing protein [Nanoarchaeota archaeon]|nr:nucleotidyltransferase domain-containing protein [Nanoarchaeota archaeon]
MDLNDWIMDSADFIDSEFNLQLNKSELKQYSPENWQKFCQTNGFDAKSEGLYVPQSYSAYVNINSPALISNRFHEYFGHGLFCEHSHIGKKLVEIVQNDGNGDKFLNDEINPQVQSLGLCKQNIANYEGFALWLEALLCRETGNSNVWRLKKDRLPDDYVALFESFHNAEEDLTRFGFMSQLGFPKFYNDNKIINVLNKMYNINFENIEFAVLYGSQKPNSDIDLFVVSSNPSTNYFNGWLDIYELNKDEFNHLSSDLDISVTDPLFSGKLIHGSKNSFERIKKQVYNQPITDNAINHNVEEAEKQKQYLDSLSDTDKRKKDCLSYIDSFSQNAEQLQMGNKPLTLLNLQQI